MKMRLASALTIGAAALTPHAPAVAVPPEQPAFEKPRAAYRTLYRAAERAPRFDPGRDILRHGLRGGGAPPMSRVVRSNRVMWRALHPEPEPTYPSEALRRIALCESGGDPTAVSAGGTYRGLYQFDLATWRGVGGTGDPAAAGPAEQGRRAAILYARRGAAPWPVCG